MKFHRLLLVLIGSGLLGVSSFALARPNVAPHTTGDVVINEVAWGGTAASSSDEWIELYNNTAVSIPLAGWRLTTADGLDLSLHGEIGPHGYYLIERTDDTTISDIPADWSGPFGGSGLKNTGETITLTDALDAVIDTANGDGGSWPGGTTAATMERLDSTALDTPGNWGTHTGHPRNGMDASGAPINGTPKCRNAVSPPAADLVAVKSGPMQAAPGTPLTYTLHYHNLGNVIALSTTLTDTLPAGVTYITSTPPYPTAVDSRTLVWMLGDAPITLTAPCITVAVYAPADAGGMITNSITATSAVTEATPATNSARWNTLISAPAPVLTLEKTGPTRAVPHTPLTYTLILSNTGNTAAHGVRLTDTLPAGLVFVAQTAPYSLTQPDAATLVWEVGDLAPGTGGHITLTLTLGEALTTILTNVATATASSGETAGAMWSAPVQPGVKLYAVQPGNYGGISGEMVAITNPEVYTVDLDGWCIDDKTASTSRACFPNGAQVAAGQTLWLAEQADGFYPLWGFDADWASVSITRPVPLLMGNWPGFTDNGEAVYLLDDGGNAVDVLAYGQGVAESGWRGSSVPHPYPGYENRGQVLYRKLDESTGLAVPDTDSASDWAQDPDDPFDGRKLRYPGWDTEAFFFPVEVSATSQITLAVAPEGMLDFILKAVSAAQHSLVIEGYTLGSVPLYEAIDARIRAGVQVTLLLESTPAGGMNNAERWVAQHLHQPPTSTVYLMGGNTRRYRYQHAKFIIVDGRTAIISTDNCGENSLPSDPMENGTMGHRGFALHTDNADVVARLNALFQIDCDPLHHTDVFPYSEAYAPPADFVPLPPVDWTTYTVAFSPTLVTTASHLTLLHAPEHTLRRQDALIGLLNDTLAGSSIDVMQMNEPAIWSSNTGDAGRNPRIAALIAAAQRGVSVRLLLDAFYDDPLSDSGNTATCLYLRSLHLPTLQCRLANVTGLGIHAKIFLVDDGNETWVHLGSINGSETSNKVNREMALQFTSPAAYSYVRAVFDHDWDLGHGPMVYHLYLPLTLRDYVPPVDYPLMTEVFINPGGEDAGQEWIEVYHPGDEAVSLAGWSLGDAINAGDYGDGRYLFPPEASLLPRQVIVVAACASQFAARYGFNPAYEWTDCDPLVPDMRPDGAWEGFGIALGNASDEVLLLDTTVTIVDSAAWGGAPRAGVIPFPIDVDSAFPSDATLKRYPPAYDRNDCSRDFYISYQPSPGLVSETK
ncbi:MAG TPA: lamin tail domain-containing protein [Anaerolineae bacterium]|nr:lamin tail domain-containing protein [Anaerolineae bacterium]HQH38520.1 lamin tail domain-containing protein [Anaerolineae bacterium]